MSEAASIVISVLLFATSSFVASAFVALVVSLFKLVVAVASDAVRVVDAVAIVVVKTPSALVALVTSDVSAA